MAFFSKTICVYCEQPITLFDKLFGNVYNPSDSTQAHKTCRVEPKAGE